MIAKDPRSHLVMVLMICRGYYDKNQNNKIHQFFEKDLKKAEICADNFLKNKKIDPIYESILLISLCSYAAKIKNITGIEQGIDKEELLKILEYIPPKPPLKERMEQWKEMEVREAEVNLA